MDGDHRVGPEAPDDPGPYSRSSWSPQPDPARPPRRQYIHPACSGCLQWRKMSEPVDLGPLVAVAFGVRNPNIHPLPGSWEGRIYLVMGSGEPLVLRMTDDPTSEHDIQVLSYLERHGYPAPSLVRTTDSADRVPVGTESILVTTFIEGTVADFSLNTLYKLGERLGQLHSLPLESQGTLPPRRHAASVGHEARAQLVRACRSVCVPLLARYV